MPSALNEKVVGEYRGLFAKASSCLLVDMNGMSVQQAAAFRSAFREKSLYIEVVRNALATIALKEHGYGKGNGAPSESMNQLFSGPTAVVYAPSGASDEATILAAKTLLDWKKKAAADKPAVKGALFEGQVLDAGRAEGLAKMPSRLEVLGQIVTLALSPGRRLAGAIVASGGRVAASIKGLVEKLEKESPATTPESPATDPAEPASNPAAGGGDAAQA